MSSLATLPKIILSIIIVWRYSCSSLVISFAIRLVRVALSSGSNVVKSEEQKRESLDDHLAKVLVFFTDGEAKNMAQILLDNQDSLEVLASETLQKKRKLLEEINQKLLENTLMKQSVNERDKDSEIL